MSTGFKFKTKLWMYPGEGAWHFVTLPKAIADDIKLITSDTKNRFGSVKVLAELGSSKWRTSVFPDKQSRSYLLPVKKEIRLKNTVDVGDTVAVKLHIIEQ